MDYRSTMTKVALALGSLSGLAGCGGDDLDPSTQTDATTAPVVSWEAFQSHAEKSARWVDGEKIYIVEWDIPIRESELYDYYRRTFVNTEKSTVDVIVANGDDNVWPNHGQMSLTYCVSTAFGTNYGRMRGEASRATWAWMRAANVRFIYRPEHDANCQDSNAAVQVPIQPYTGDGACAFFPQQNGRPNCTAFGRAVVIDVADIDTWDTVPIFGQVHPNLTTEGTLRHELGHVLGLRHEHIREANNAINNCVGEVNNPGPIRALTNYDKDSAMHYPWCDGTRTSPQTVTPRDATGLRNLYGPPAWSVLFDM